MSDIEGPVRAIDVYYEAGCAIERLPTAEQYKVCAALCIQCGYDPPRRLPSPKESDGK